tara:strand:- start:232 stop:546 length:315 start_codon:yes stop_codon:yes gene_type:complete
MEEFILTLEELQTIFSLGYHRGVNDGEDGIPEDFKSFLPRHLEWYAQLGLERKEEFFGRLHEYLYYDENRNPDGTLKGDKPLTFDEWLDKSGETQKRITRHLRP